MWCSGPRSSLPRIGWPRPRVRKSVISDRVTTSDSTPATTPAIMTAIKCDAPRARRTTSRSSKASTWSPIVWVVSWPLPATTTTSPARAPSMARAIAAARSGSTTTRATVVGVHAAQHGPDDGGRVLRSRVVRCHDDPIGAGRRDRAHPRPLRVIAVPSGPEHDDHLPGGDGPGGLDDLGQPVGRVGVVDDHRDVVADRPTTRTRSKRPGTVPSGGQAGGDGLDRRRRSPPPSWRRRACWRR